jgi:hypothetical protein
MGISDRLVGTWRLVSFEYILANGATVKAYGHEPKGLLVYDRAGYMTAQIMSPSRPRFASGDRRSGTLEELHAAIEGYIAYFGTYEIDEARGCVVHTELGDVFPNAVGTRQVRFYRFENDLLVLDVPPIVLGGERATARVVWARVEGS